MKKYIFLFTVLFCLVSYGQEYQFVSKEFLAIDKYKYLDFVQKKAENKIFNENGSIIPLVKMDSISKNYLKNPYKPIYFGDSINNKSITVIKYLSKEEYKTINDEFQDKQKKDTENRKQLKGRHIENLDLTDINGNKFSLESLSGKIIVLNFWFTKCAPCIKEMPDLNDLKEKYKENPIVFFAITYDKKNLVDDFLKKIKLDFTVIPNDRKTINQFGIQFFPTNLVIDSNGKVVYVNELFGGNGIKEIDKILKKLTKD
ncbi:TlpA family protein disulfide reductase [Flavobacterium sp.]|uniref:TlpA family protein disulfide reductase n=1 Tax=Flavobacterium sp. TaxID=239 RepID=UPI003753C684